MTRTLDERYAGRDLPRAREWGTTLGYTALGIFLLVWIIIAALSTKGRWAVSNLLGIALAAVLIVLAVGFPIRRWLTLPPRPLRRVRSSCNAAEADSPKQVSAEA
jgi:hypothetical protein